MKEIKLTKNMHFIMETEGDPPEEAIKEFTKFWDKAFPNNMIFFVKKGSMSIIEVDDK